MIDSAKYQAQASELSQKLWAIANDLRGNMDSTKFRNYILGTIFYSYLSERTEEYMQEILKEDGLTYEQRSPMRTTARLSSSGPSSTWVTSSSLRICSESLCARLFAQRVMLISSASRITSVR